VGTEAGTVEVISERGRAAAVLHPTRLRILHALATPDSAAGLGRRLDEPRQRLNHHLRALEAEGLVVLVEERRAGNMIERVVRASASSYVMDPAVLGPVAVDPARAGDELSTSYLVAVAARVVRELARLRRLAADAGKRLATLTIDTEVRFRSAADQAAFGEELAAAVAGVVERYHDGEAPRGRRFRVVVGSYPVPPTEPQEDE